MTRSTLRYVVELHARRVTRDAMGGDVETWARIDSRRAAIEPLRTSERVEADTVEGRRTHKITLRHTPDLEQTGRILFGTRVFHVDSIQNRDERGEWTDVMAVEDAG